MKMKSKRLLRVMFILILIMVFIQDIFVEVKTKKMIKEVNEYNKVMESSDIYCPNNSNNILQYQKCLKQIYEDEP